MNLWIFMNQGRQNQSKLFFYIHLESNSYWQFQDYPQNALPLL